MPESVAVPRYSAPLTFADNEPAAVVMMHLIVAVTAVDGRGGSCNGSVTEANESLTDEPEKVNKDPYGEGWMIKIKMSNSGEVDSLLTPAEYEDFTKAESE